MCTRNISGFILNWYFVHAYELLSLMINHLFDGSGTLPDVDIINQLFINLSD